MIVRPTSQIPADATPLNMYLVDNHIVVAMPDHLVAPKPAAKPAAKHARVLTDAELTELIADVVTPDQTYRVYVLRWKRKATRTVVVDADDATVRCARAQGLVSAAPGSGPGVDPPVLSR